MKSTVRASGLLLLASVCHASDMPLARTVAFAGLAPGPLSSLGLRGGGIQFWTNQNEIKAAPERWKGGLAKLRAMCAGTTVDVAAVGKASNLAGKWSKVDTVGQEKAMLMLGLPYVFRKGANLLSTVLLTTDSTAFNINTKGALVVSIKESYAYDGAVSACSRRDKRWGKHQGKIVQATNDKVVLDVTWADPHGGHLTETFEVDKTGKEMTHTSKILVNEDATTGKKPTESYTYYSVYKRVD
mmetsp:Transcript_96219/g.140652  ORF Transcript_96219/g.140652 Transcript_96219/m.140652 type:complete len:242 (+) Transcript_96219:1-726(+)